MNHAVVGFAILLMLVNVNRGQATQVSDSANQDSAATSTFAEAAPEEGPPPEDVLYEIVCEDASEELLAREFAFADMLVLASDRIPASLGLHHVQYDCTEVRFYLGTVVQTSSGEYYTTLFTLSVKVSATDTDEQLSTLVESMVGEMIVKDTAAQGRRNTARENQKESSKKTGA